MASAQPQNRVMTFGRKKQAIAVVSAVKGNGMIKVNGIPINLVQPQQLRTKLLEPVLLIGKGKFNGVNIRVRTRGGGSIAQIYAARQAIAKAIVSYYQKYVDEEQKMQIKDTYMRADRSLLVTDPRRTECKKFGGGGARSRYTKSYR